MAQLEDEAALFLWQRAVFVESDSDSSDGNRATADSLRLRLGQLEYLHCKERLASSSSPHVHHLMESYLHSYAAAVDDQEGINNYATAVQVLAAGQKNESKDWKSGLTLESMMATPEVKALLKEEELSPHATLLKGAASRGLGGGGTSHSLSSRGSPNTSAQKFMGSSSKQGCRVSIDTCSTAQKSPPSPYGIFSSRQQTGNPSNRFPYSTSRVVKSGWPRQQPSGSEKNVSTRSPAATSSHRRESRWGGNGFDREDRGRGRKRPRVEGGAEAERRVGPRGGVEEEEEERPPPPFITARDQYVINQRKKFGGSGGGETGTGTGTGTGGGLNSGSYGVSKKSLGARRTTGSKFVPPVKRDEEDGVSQAIASRVFRGPSGGGGGTTGGSNSLRLPPELEGDERLRNIEPRMVELIMNEIMDHGAAVEWEDVAGLEFAKATIKEIVVWPMLRPDIFTGLRGPPKGILLFGPPGTGKTLIGKCIASQVNATFFSISASSLTSKWVGEGEKMVRALFAVARCYQPAVIFMDEIDSLLSQRSDSEHESSRRIKTEFLVQLDGAATNADDRLLVIGATNRPQEIDEAARRRLVKRLYIPLPDPAARRQIVTNLMREQAFSLSEEEIGSICEQSEGYSGADMANVCREAAYGPIREAAESIQHIAAEEMRPVLYKDFEAAFQIIRPSVSEKDLELYEEWNRQFGCGRRGRRQWEFREEFNH